MTTGEKAATAKQEYVGNFTLKRHACYSQNINAAVLNIYSDGKGYPEASTFIFTNTECSNQLTGE